MTPNSQLFQDLSSVLYDEAELAAAVKALGERITQDYQGKSPLMICILKGASLFFTDLIRQIDLPLMKPALATVTLYFIVDRWNEWFWSNLLFLDSKMWPMQLELRQILWTSSALAADVPAELGRRTYADGMKAAAVIVTMLPIMCVYPFLQKYFAKGVMIGAIKS